MSRLMFRVNKCRVCGKVWGLAQEMKPSDWHCAVKEQNDKQRPTGETNGESV